MRDLDGCLLAFALAGMGMLGLALFAECYHGKVAVDRAFSRVCLQDGGTLEHGDICTAGDSVLWRTDDFPEAQDDPDA